MILPGPGNSDCDKSDRNLSLAEVPDHTRILTGELEGWRAGELEGSLVTKLKVTTGCDTVGEMSPARVTRALTGQQSHH